MSLKIKTLCVYCGSSDRIHPDYLQAAQEMGAAAARRGLDIVYGAGSTGLMGAVANGAIEAGGQVIGVIPGYFNTPQLAHNGLARLEVVDTIHTRKARLVELGDAFVALPGGYGTFEEFFEVLTWAQIGLHAKPIGLLNVRAGDARRGYFTPLLELVEQARQDGFIYDEHRALFSAADAPEALLDALLNHQHPDGLERWLTRED